MGETTSSGSGPDALRGRIIQAYAAGDAERAAALYVNEGVQQPPGRPAAVGRDAIRESCNMLFGRGGLSLRMEPLQTVVGEQGARERGRITWLPANRPCWWASTCP
jgi:hypothetical protein